jgi:hypothetical protein
MPTSSQDNWAVGPAPPWFQELDPEVQRALVAMNMAPREWLDQTGAAYEGAEPQWAQTFGAMRSLEFLPFGGLGPTYAYGSLQTTMRAGWLPGVGEWTYQGRYGQTMAQAQFWQNMLNEMGLNPYRRLTASWEEFPAFANTRMNLAFARSQYWMAQQQMAPFSITYSGARIASMMAPQFWPLRAFGFPFVSAMQQGYAASMQAPFLNEALQYDPKLAAQMISTTPTFAAFNLPSLQSEAVSSLGFWTAIQVGGWVAPQVFGFPGRMGLGQMLGISLMQPGLGFLMQGAATQYAWSMIPGYQPPAQQLQQLQQYYQLGAGLTAAGAGITIADYVRSMMTPSMQGQTRFVTWTETGGLNYPAELSQRIGLSATFGPQLTALGRGAVLGAGLAGFLAGGLAGRYLVQPGLEQLGYSPEQAEAGGLFASIGMGLVGQYLTATRLSNYLLSRAMMGEAVDLSSYVGRSTLNPPGGMVQSIINRLAEYPAPGGAVAGSRLMTGVNLAALGLMGYQTIGIINEMLNMPAMQRAYITGGGLVQGTPIGAYPGVRGPYQVTPTNPQLAWIGANPSLGSFAYNAALFGRELLGLPIPPDWTVTATQLGTLQSLGLLPEVYGPVQTGATPALQRYYQGVSGWYLGYQTDATAARRMLGAQTVSWLLSLPLEQREQALASIGGLTMQQLAEPALRRMPPVLSGMYGYAILDYVEERKNFMAAQADYNSLRQKYEAGVINRDTYVAGLQGYQQAYASYMADITVLGGVSRAYDVGREPSISTFRHDVAYPAFVRGAVAQGQTPLDVLGLQRGYTGPFPSQFDIVNEVTNIRQYQKWDSTVLKRYKALQSYILPIVENVLAPYQEYPTVGPRGRPGVGADWIQIKDAQGQTHWLPSGTFEGLFSLREYRNFEIQTGQPGQALRNQGVKILKNQMISDLMQQGYSYNQAWQMAEEVVQNTIPDAPTLTDYSAGGGDRRQYEYVHVGYAQGYAAGDLWRNTTTGELVTNPPVGRPTRPRTSYVPGSIFGPEGTYQGSGQFGGAPTTRTVNGETYQWNWSGGYWQRTKDVAHKFPWETVPGAAQGGFEGIVTRPVMFLVGEVGPEKVTVEPTVGKRFDLIRKPLPPPSTAQLTNQIAKVLVGEA